MSILKNSLEFQTECYHIALETSTIAYHFLNSESTNDIIESINYINFLHRCNFEPVKKYTTDIYSLFDSVENKQIKDAIMAFFEEVNINTRSDDPKQQQTQVATSLMSLFNTMNSNEITNVKEIVIILCLNLRKKI